MSKEAIDSIYTETQLITGCRNNERKAQAALYEYYASEMYVVAMRYAQTTHEADDILQEAFIKIFGNIADFKGEGALGAWIRRIVVNTALKQNRKQIDQAPKEEITDWNIEHDEDTIISDYSFQELLELIQSLATGYRTVFNLYAIEGYKHREIAEMLGITEGASKSQYARAKIQLQELIREQEAEANEPVQEIQLNP